MEFLGVGINELIFVIIIALIVLGPKDMEKAGRTIGRWLRSIVTSDGWKVFQQTSREIRMLPTRLMREANEELSQFNDQMNSIQGELPKVNLNLPNRSKAIAPLPTSNTDNKIAPPATNTTPGGSDQEPDA